MSLDGSLTPTRDRGVLSPERSMSCSNRTRVSALVRMRRMRLAMIQPTSSTASAALVDFEEAGPGDPMLDVGNFIAHLCWRSRFGRQVLRSWTDCWTSRKRIGPEIASELSIRRHRLAPGVGLEP